MKSSKFQIFKCSNKGTKDRILINYYHNIQILMYTITEYKTMEIYFAKDFESIGYTMM